jgi:DNA-binding ferritin-like protein (Dps family)
MNLEEALGVFPYLGYLIRQFEKGQFRNLDEKSDFVDKVCGELNRQEELVSKTVKSEREFLVFAEDMRREFLEFEERRTSRPMNLAANPREAQQWHYDELEAQRFSFVLHDVVRGLETIDAKRTQRQLEAIGVYLKFMNGVLEDLNKQWNQRIKQIAAEGIEALRKKGVHVKITL